MRWFAFLVLLLSACNNDVLESADPSGSSRGQSPGDLGDMFSIPADDDGQGLSRAIDEGLNTQGKGDDHWRFVLIRAIDRHDTRLPDEAFHFVVGAGVEMEPGGIRARRVWSNGGQFHGDNSELERCGVAIGIERGATRPYSEEVTDAVARICEALARRIDLHPDCVVAMEEVPFARQSEFDSAERRVAAIARARVPVPPVVGTLIVGGVKVEYEKRDTTAGREIGMMLRKRFDGENRGMLFVYPHRAQRRFWMRNCLIPMDLAYIKKGRIEQIENMDAQAGVPTGGLPRYESITPIRFVLEMPSGWFAKNSVAVGAAVTGLPK